MLYQVCKFESLSHIELSTTDFMPRVRLSIGLQIITLNITERFSNQELSSSLSLQIETAIFVRS